MVRLWKTTEILWPYRLGEGRREWLYNDQIQPTRGPALPTNTSNNLMTRLDTNAIRNINTLTSYLSGDPLRIGRTGYFVAGQDFDKIENARKLKPSEYTYNSSLVYFAQHKSQL